jgi:hypothetical protein
MGSSRDRNLGWIVRLGRQHKTCRVSTPAAVSMRCLRKQERVAHKKSSTAMACGQVGECSSMSRWWQGSYARRWKAQALYVTATEG